MKYSEVSEGLIVTLPRAFFTEEKGAMRRFLSEIHQVNTIEDYYWYRVMKNLPKRDVLYVYLVINNFIKYRFTYGGIVRDKDFAFHRMDGTFKEFNKANAIILAGPVIKAPMKYPMRGFQGFRYTDKIF